MDRRRHQRPVHDEDVANARRLQETGVDCTLHVIPGAYHNFDLSEAKAPISRAFVKAQITELDEALNGV
jgi:acetyl esterase/lipase